MASEKEPAVKIHCLFHQRTECSCITPVTTTEKLRERLKNQIAINERLNRYESDEQIKTRRDQETILCENRLGDLRD